MEETTARRELLVSKGWLQAVALVVLFGFFVMGLLAYRTYAAEPPIPARVVDPAGTVVSPAPTSEARQLKFITNQTNSLIEWLRLPGDLLFIVGGALPV